MTAIFYPDCSAISPNARWKATAVSPHNGSILRQDGSSPEDDFAYKYGSHQSEFRYRLEAEDGSVVWERWQPPGENSPDQLLVANDGSLVVRTHGFSPELIVFRKGGEITLRVAIESSDSGSEDPEEFEDSYDEREGDERVSVAVDTMKRTTAGDYWTHHSWPYFVSSPNGLLFVWRTCSGQRIVIDPTNGSLISESGAKYEEVVHLLDATERQDSLDLLKWICEKKENIARLLRKADAVSPASQERISKMSAAILMAGVGGNREAIPLLRRLEDLNCPSYSTRTTGMRGYDIEVQYFRPLIQHSLKLMDEVPAGFPCYHFNRNGSRYPAKELIENRAGALARIRRRMKAKEVLDIVGTPDYVHCYPEKRGRFSVWPENWEYDEFDGENWFTTVLHWEQGKSSNPLVSVERVEASWKRSSDRLMEILQF